MRKFSIVGIGISTGGPKALSSVIPELAPDLPVSIVIAQHMPPLFTKSLAERLDALSAIQVSEAVHGEVLKPAHVYICPGGMHATIEKGGVITMHPKEKYAYTYTPSADLLLSDIGDRYGEKGLCIIMTGMGSDGMEGVRQARLKGCYVLAQSEKSSTIYGMPKAIIKNELQHEIVDLKDMGTRINQLCK